MLSIIYGMHNESEQTAADIPQKVEKTLHRSVTRVTKYCKKHMLRAKVNASPDPADPGNQVSSAAVRNHSNTRAGGEDYVSSDQTPSNKRRKLFFL